MAQDSFDIDKISTPDGDIEVVCIGHGTLMLKFNELVIHIDPVSREADYSKLPEADIILVTHSHGDHLDPAAIKLVSGGKPIVICNEISADKLEKPIVLKNGDRYELDANKGYRCVIEAVPAYNIVNERSPGNPFHPKGEGNGYLITISDKKFYIGGDTEHIPEMSELKDVDIAFLPMNLPYTMSPEMLALAASSFNPKILYPYHFGSSDTNKLLELLEDSAIEVRVRNF